MFGAMIKLLVRIPTYKEHLGLSAGSALPFQLPTTIFPRRQQVMDGSNNWVHVTHVGDLEFQGLPRHSSFRAFEE